MLRASLYAKRFVGVKELVGPNQEGVAFFLAAFTVDEEGPIPRIELSIRCPNVGPLTEVHGTRPARTQGLLLSGVETGGLKGAIRLNQWPPSWRAAAGVLADSPGSPFTRAATPFTPLPTVQVYDEAQNLQI